MRGLPAGITSDLSSLHTHAASWPFVPHDAQRSKHEPLHGVYLGWLGNRRVLFRPLSRILLGVAAWAGEVHLISVVVRVLPLVHVRDMQGHCCNVRGSAR